MKEKILTIVLNAVSELNQTLNNKVDLSCGEAALLYGQQGVLDSLALVSLIVTVEAGIEQVFDKTLILANEKSLSQRNSPFLSIGSLVNYIIILLSEEGVKTCHN